MDDMMENKLMIASSVAMNFCRMDDMMENKLMIVSSVAMNFYSHTFVFRAQGNTQANSNQQTTSAKVSQPPRHCTQLAP